jgi:hypothetical protein
VSASTAPASLDEPPTGRPEPTDAGQAAPLAVLILLVTGVVVLGVSVLGRATLDRADARTAADAAALAGAVDGPAGARALAAANGGRVVDVVEDGAGITVTVRVGDAVATARAERAGPAVGGGGTDRAGLAPAMLAAIDRAERLLGRPITITSGFRSREEQQRLWDQRASNPYPVAPPGTSRHESGYAIDVPRSLVGALRGVAPASGLCRPLPVSDPIHFELCRWTPT